MIPKSFPKRTKVLPLSPKPNRTTNLEALLKKQHKLPALLSLSLSLSLSLNQIVLVEMFCIKFFIVDL